MRSEKEVYDIVLNFAKTDKRIRMVTLEGSRTNTNIPPDDFQDFDITFFVTDMDSFTSDDKWLDIFGERLILQKPEDMINNENIIHISNMTVNLEEYTFKVNGERIPLTKKEIETMWTLASNPNKVFTRDNLLDSLWGYDYYGDSRTVDSHIKRLRAKLDSVEHPDWTIKTIWGVGYKFEISEENF